VTGLVAACAVVGLLIGPSLHHLGVRAALRRPFDGVWPRCEGCNERRGLFVSACRACRGRIRRREPAIWLASAVGSGLAAWVAGPTWVLTAHLVFVWLTTVLVVTDLDAKLIPNRVLYPGTAAVALLLAAGAALDGRISDLRTAALCAAGYFGVLLLVAVLSRGGFGMGDVKLAVVIGLVLGLWGWRVFARGIFFTGLVGGIPALYLIARGRAGRGDELPYGPAMIFGSWAGLVFTGML